MLKERILSFLKKLAIRCGKPFGITVISKKEIFSDYNVLSRVTLTTEEKDMLLGTVSKEEKVIHPGF